MSIHPRKRPLVLVSCSVETMDLPGFGPLRHQAVFERYVEALRSAFDCTVLLMPALADAGAQIPHYVAIADGALLTGAASNVQPHLYGDPVPEEPGRTDPDRDATTLPFVRAAVAAGVPLLGICRGMQEINVAFGGTLHRRVHELAGFRDHRGRKDLPFPDRYRPAHRVRPRLGGWLQKILTRRGIDASVLEVNSLHGQGVDRLGRGVVAEALSEDGLVEAIRLPDAPALALGVQWHNEWYVDTTPLHRALFEEFAAACRKRFVLRDPRLARAVA